MKNVVKDFASANRLKEAYRHLYANFGIDSQIKFAEALRVQRTALSAAMNGNKAIADAPFKANRTTAYSGSLFTNSGAFSLSLNDEWDTDYTGTW